MIRLEIRHNLPTIEAFFPALATNLRASQEAMVRLGVDLVNARLESNLSHPGSPLSPAPIGRLHARTRALLNSRLTRVEHQGSQIVGEIRLQAPYAGAHEFGATIRPRRSRFLAIPLPTVMDGRGVARGSPRSFSNTFVAMGRRHPIIFQRTGGLPTPLFVLKTEVRIPARRPLATSLEESQPMLQTLIGEQLRVSVEEATRRGGSTA